ncbi:small redox-active disulfide protein 2 [Breznakia sp. PF5-3]|uniref:thioredoxin family protein n=1 Tax=unclassified Breznakia TaxID=2623764 RepID=UPI0024059F12|nr:MULTISPECIES: thioredoxin family protein [unclassified Breznakia]MDF9824548.1 small redox-active disulfide protein 2 [Breznakia sp. PM6-1]MDF9835334.1 small redox-active disulfide protein 2 [Breznakia sp. PF5-3]MDF9837070.1 small redox-active disulfide protein 2 [Breznakia sp. PFB2-8]MDF9858995.1 small redox-active disulfide protein 2 [Breznakia sp. PH5-24]
MKLFNKKKTECDCGGNSDTTNSVKGAEVKVLGSGCAKCVELASNAKQALEELGRSTDIEKVTDMSEIAAYGVMSTPALVYQGKVVSYGKVLTIEQIKELI